MTSELQQRLRGWLHGVHDQALRAFTDSDLQVEMDLFAAQRLERLLRRVADDAYRRGACAMNQKWASGYVTPEPQWATEVIAAALQEESESEDG